MSVELLVTSNGIQSFGGFAADDTTAEEITSLIPAVLMRRATRANDRIFRRSLLRTYRAAVSQTARLCIGILRRRSTSRRSGTWSRSTSPRCRSPRCRCW